MIVSASKSFWVLENSPWHKMSPTTNLCNGQNLSSPYCQLALNSLLIIWKDSLFSIKKASFIHSFTPERAFIGWVWATCLSLNQLLCSDKVGFWLVRSVSCTQLIISLLTNFMYISFFSCSAGWILSLFACLTSTAFSFSNTFWINLGSVVPHCSNYIL